MERLISLLGLFAILAIAWALGSNRSRVNLRAVGMGVALQFAFALLVLRTEPGRALFDGIGELVQSLLGFVREGTVFVVGYPGEASAAPEDAPEYSLLKTFVFGVLPTIVFFSSLMSMAYWLGVMQWIVRGMAWIMQRVLGVSGAESLSAAANVFVGHTEAPLVIRPYLEGLTRSELNAVMVGGFSTVTGGLLAVYAGMGIDPAHLITASVISAPASLVVAKLLQPETEVPATRSGAVVQIPRRGVNLIEAAAIGVSDGVKLAINVGAMLLVFLALIAMVDAVVVWVGDRCGLEWTLAGILAYVGAPLAFLIGVPASECLAAGELLSLKVVANEIVAYQQLSEWMGAEGEQARLGERSKVLLTYALAGFSNFAAIGIQIGGIGGIAASRRSDLAQLGLRAMLGGVLACCTTACVVGVIL